MMMQEFIEVARISLIDQESYEAIEMVYTYHPAIKDKKHIAKLYNEFGMTVIYDMLPRAQRIASREAEIQKLNNQVATLKQEIESLSK